MLYFILHMVDFMAKNCKPQIVIPYSDSQAAEIRNLINEYLNKYDIFERQYGVPLLLLFDRRSSAYYLICHLDSKSLVSGADTDAVLDPDESDDYKLNRDFYEDTYAYKLMEKDAESGRSFEDIVVEYDTSYRPDKPLKVFGGQHRIKAVAKALQNGISAIHGCRVYFNLTVEQRVNIAMVNNTSIAVSNDLLDRMQEEWLGGELRSWCQSVGLLDQGQNFADRRNQEGIPTVRIARTLVVNFVLGRKSSKQDFHAPVVCASGTSIDKTYGNVRKEINWSDKVMRRMGNEFAKLHALQRKRVLSRVTDKYMEFANKAIHPCVVASWSYAAGHFQHSQDYLDAHYALSDISSTTTSDPLNAAALLNARLKGTDPDTYRGLGARINPDELGRMFEVFLLQATRAKTRGITPKLANAAIQSYVAKRAKDKADRALKGL